MQYRLETFYGDRMSTFLEKEHQVHKKLKNVIPRITLFCVGASSLQLPVFFHVKLTFLASPAHYTWLKTFPKYLNGNKMKPDVLLRRHWNCPMENFHLYLKSARYNVHRCCWSYCYRYFCPRTDDVETLSSSFTLHYFLACCVTTTH